MQSSSDLKDKAAVAKSTKGSGYVRRFARPAQYTLIIRCVEAPAGHPEWQDKEWVRCDDPARLVSHNLAYWESDFEALKSRAANSAQRIARMIQCNEGGVWIGRLRDSTNDPFPDCRLSGEQKQGMDQHILNGPDGPGRRFVKMLTNRPNASKLSVLAHSLKSVPRPDRINTVAGREMIERLRSMPPAPSAAPPDNSDLWAMTDDLADAQPTETTRREREPGED